MDFSGFIFLGNYKSVAKTYSYLAFWYLYVATLLLTKKDAQHESFKLSFIWDKMRTAAWETAPQIALRDGSKQAMGEGQYIRFWWRGNSMKSSAYFIRDFLLVWVIDVIMKGFSAFLDMRRCKDWNHGISSWKYLSEDLFHQIPWSTAPWSPPWMPSGVLKVNSCSSIGFSLHRGRGQMPLSFGHWHDLGKCQLVVDTSYQFMIIKIEVWPFTLPTPDYPNGHAFVLQTVSIFPFKNILKEENTKTRQKL